MKLIIDVTEKDYNEVIDYGITTNPAVAKAIKDGTPIRDNATNGEVIETLFPYAKRVGTVFVDDKENVFFIHILWDWWNAKYKAESEG